MLMEEAVVVNKGDDLIDLPPGFRFHPTDEEIITHYLTEKVMNSSFCASAIGEVDLNKCEPWDLPKKAKMGEKEWIFHKSTGIKKSSIHEIQRMNSFGDDFLDYSSLPPFMDVNQNSGPSTSSFNDGDDNEFKAMATRSSDGNYFSNTGMLNNNQSFVQPANTSYQAPDSSFQYPHQIPASNPLYTFQTNPNMAGYFHQGKSCNSFANFQNSTFWNNDQTLLRALARNSYGETSGLEKQCKVEQFSSNQSVVSLSQDTGLSTDVNTNAEISSVVSKQELGSHDKVFDDLEGPSAGPIADLDCLWDY
ncbi:hypothetical protein SADUNF_Sadunf19G0038000 [Salix dunnii]|uniref:NAC domain-containing protein n=1 Tax=Salix dunnii TaxID=1413687 RepID=A0A835J0Z6_9ROSI|nr:hypothetical protein SADUNF_Sadunf19G0038000 [Salix dunnii]